MTPANAGGQGTVTWDGLQVGATAHYECPTGFDLEGKHTRTCQQGGTWSEITPSCLMMP